MRGEDGQWIYGFSKNVGSTSAYLAELWGLKLAKSRGFTQVELQMDSKIVVKCLKGDGKGSANCWNLVSHIKQLLVYDWDVKISQDILANVGCNIDNDLVIYERPAVSLA